MYVITVDNDGEVPEIKIMCPLIEIQSFSIKLFKDQAVITTSDGKQNLPYGSIDAGDEIGHINVSKRKSIRLADLDTNIKFANKIAKLKGLIDEKKKASKPDRVGDRIKPVKEGLNTIGKQHMKKESIQ